MLICRALSVKSSTPFSLGPLCPSNPLLSPPLPPRAGRNCLGGVFYLLYPVLIKSDPFHSLLCRRGIYPQFMWFTTFHVPKWVLVDFSTANSSEIGRSIVNRQYCLFSTRWIDLSNEPRTKAVRPTVTACLSDFVTPTDTDDSLGYYCTPVTVEEIRNVN